MQGWGPRYTTPTQTGTMPGLRPEIWREVQQGTLDDARRTGGDARELRTLHCASRGPGQRYAQHLPLPEAEELESTSADERARHASRNLDLRRAADGQRPVPVRAAPGAAVDGLARRARLTFDLRSGLLWSDGQPFTSRDVLFT